MIKNQGKVLMLGSNFATHFQIKLISKLFSYTIKYEHLVQR